LLPIIDAAMRRAGILPERHPLQPGDGDIAESGMTLKIIGREPEHIGSIGKAREHQVIEAGRACDRRVDLARGQLLAAGRRRQSQR
jgi:hypothetical protein